MIKITTLLPLSGILTDFLILPHSVLTGIEGDWWCYKGSVDKGSRQRNQDNKRHAANLRL